MSNGNGPPRKKKPTPQGAAREGPNWLPPGATSIGPQRGDVLMSQLRDFAPGLYDVASIVSSTVNRQLDRFERHPLSKLVGSPRELVQPEGLFRAVVGPFGRTGSFFSDLPEKLGKRKVKVEPPKGLKSFIATWNNNRGRWDLSRGYGPQKRGAEVDLDANEVIVYGRNMREVEEALVDAPTLPLASNSFEARAERGEFGKVYKDDRIREKARQMEMRKPPAGRSPEETVDDIREKLNKKTLFSAGKLEPKPKPQGEWIEGPAVKLPSGEIAYGTGPRHNNIIKAAVDEGKATWDDVEKLGYHTENYGWITNRGDFVTNLEAAPIAEQAGQLLKTRKDAAGNFTDLWSEDFLFFGRPPLKVERGGLASQAPVNPEQTLLDRLLNKTNKPRETPFEQYMRDVEGQQVGSMIDDIHLIDMTGLKPMPDLTGPLFLPGGYINEVENQAYQSMWNKLRKQVEKGGRLSEVLMEPTYQKLVPEYIPNILAWLQTTNFNVNPRVKQTLLDKAAKELFMLGSLGGPR